MAVEYNFTVVKADSWLTKFRWLSNGVAVDLTGYTLTLTVRATYDTSGTALATATGVVATPASGEFTFTIDSLNLPAADYVYDVQAVSGSFRKTLARGIVKVLGEVSVG